MGALREYIIPLRSLQSGTHQYNWSVGSEFLKHFEGSIITDGHFNVKMQLDNRDDVSVISLHFTGSYASNCDRCLADIEIPIDKFFTIYVKNGTEESEDPELIFLHPEDHELNMAPIVYDYLILSLPLIQALDCENLDDPPCNKDVLDRIQHEEGLHSDNSVWESLKNLNTN